MVLVLNLESDDDQTKHGCSPSHGPLTWPMAHDGPVTSLVYCSWLLLWTYSSQRKGFAKLSLFLKHRPSGHMLSISQNVRLSVRLSVRLFVRVFTFEVPFKCLFAPSSQSRMSNIFKDSESLDLNIFAWKWSKIAKKKHCFFCRFCLQNTVETMLSDGFETSGRRAYR